MSEPVNPVEALDEFMGSFCYPAQEGLIVKNLPEHPVHRRADRGNAAAYFSFEGLRALEAHVSEIAPGEETGTHRHSCEALFYVIKGQGRTVFFAEGEQSEKRIEWQAGDLFFTPIGVWHRHINHDGSTPARYLEVTTIPLMKTLGAWSIQVPPDEPDLHPTA
jgi:quercetin dioxygenase-like cupin family protein